MTDQTSAGMFNSGVQWLAQHRHAYLSSGGREGHIMDLSYAGGRPFATHLLLRYVGRKSGKRYINPLLYGMFAGEVVIVASKAGADHNPAWYTNITAVDEVQFQIATQAFRATWRQPEGAERERIWEYMTGHHPPFIDYQKSTSRQIPILLLSTRGSIPTFTEDDAD